ncbi:MAG: hypothetical protein NWP98_08120 [Erythrobacter sp.]|nr:hypothetical protein [Erythrobacter sp.]
MIFNRIAFRHARLIGLGGLMGAGLIAGTVAQSQPASPAPPVDYVDELKSCRAIADEAARLACYDAKVSTIVAASDAGDVTIVDREDITRTRRQLFGFTVPDIGIFKDDSQDKEAAELLDTTITGARRVSAKTWRFTTAEGAVWEINNAPARLASIKAGEPVQFKKASLGFYFIRINGQLGVKGKRVQ